MSTHERRQHRRILPSQLVGDFRLDDSVVGRGLRIEDISMGGVFVHAAHPPPLGRSVVVELHHPLLGVPLEVRGQVASHGGPAAGPDGRVGMGVRFDVLPLGALARLSRLLQELVSSGAAVPLAALPRAEPGPDERKEAPVGEGGSAESEDVVGVRSERIPTLVLELSAAALQARIRNVAEALTEGAVSGEERRGSTSADPAPDVTTSPVLMVQVRGLLMQLGEASMQLAEREREVARLQQDNVRLQVELGRRDERIRTLEKLAHEHGG